MLSAIKKPWFFILSGVLMTVISAVITNYYVIKNNDEIEKIVLKLDGLEKRINQNWEESSNLERLEETGTILVVISDIAKSGDQKNHAKQAAARYMEKVVRTGAVDPLSARTIRAEVEAGRITEVLGTLFNIIDKHKEATINSINDLYIEKASVERQRMSFEDRNSTLKNISLFLQIMGMIMVLSHSLMRNDSGPQLDF